MELAECTACLRSPGFESLLLPVQGKEESSKSELHCLIILLAVSSSLQTCFLGTVEPVAVLLERR